MSSIESVDNWVLGVTLGLLGSIAINTGNNIQSLGLKGLEAIRSPDSNNPKPKGRKLSILWPERCKTAPMECLNLDIIKSSSVKLKVEVKDHSQPCSSITWVIGTIIFVTGSLLNFASYAFAAQSMLASLESIQFVTNLIFGKFMLKANVTKTMLIGTGLTVTGTILAVQFSSRATLNLRTDDIKKLYKNPAYIAYIILMVGMLFLLNYVYHYYEKRKASENPLVHSDVIIPVSYSIWSALFGTQSVVQAKVLAELLSAHSSGYENIFHSWFTYVTLMLWIITVAVWLSRLNNALSKFEPLLIIPILQCSFIFFAIVSGGIFFREFNEFTITQWIGFWCGVLVMFSGLILLTPVSKRVGEEQLSKDITLLLRSKATTVSTADSGCHNDLYGSVNNVSRNESTDSKDVKTPAELAHQIAQNTKIFKRSPRQSLSQTVNQINAMKDVVMESATMFLTPPTGTNAITDAMLDEARRQEEKHIRIEKLKRLQRLLNEKEDSTREGILTNEILTLICDVGLEDHLTKYGDPRKRNLDLMRDEIESPREFRSSMLRKASEMEKQLSECLGSSREFRSSMLRKASEIEKQQKESLQEYEFQATTRGCFS